MYNEITIFNIQTANKLQNSIPNHLSRLNLWDLEVDYYLSFEF